MIRPLAVCLVIGLLALPAATAQDAATEPVDLSWIEGHWRRDTATGISEEIWTDGAGGLYLGLSRSIRDGQARGFEFLRIETRDGVAYVAQPGGQPPVRFALVEADEQRALFANPDHDFPTHIEYLREDDTLTARIWGPDGEAEAISWQWQRVER